MRTLFDRWFERAGTKHTYKSARDESTHKHIKECYCPGLVIFLAERKLKDLNEIVKMAEAYEKSHPLM